MVLAGHLTLDRGSMGSVCRTAAWQRGSVGGLFRGRISVCLRPLRKRPPSLGTHPGTWVPDHPNNVRPLARSGQCLASPAQSPAGSPPHSPQAPLNLGVYGVLPSVPCLVASARRRRWLRSSTGDLGLEVQRHGPDLHFQPGAGAHLGTQPASPQQAQSRSPSCAGPRSNQGPFSSRPSLQSVSQPVPRARRKTSKRASKQPGKQAGLCMCECTCACACWHVPAVVMVSGLCAHVCMCE